MASPRSRRRRWSAASTRAASPASASSSGSRERARAHRAAATTAAPSSTPEAPRARRLVDPPLRASRHASSVVAALAALAPRLVRLAHHDYSDRLLEDDHAARRRPLPQRLEGVVHTLERQAGRDHLVEAEETPPVELEVAGHVGAEAVRAHHAAEDRLLAEHEVRARQLDAGARRHDADHDD